MSGSSSGQATELVSEPHDRGRPTDATDFRPEHFWADIERVLRTFSCRWSGHESPPIQGMPAVGSLGEKSHVVPRAVS
jgi:hypothetical protein